MVFSRWQDSEPNRSRFIISNRFRSAITDIRPLRGPDIGSDQNLLKINFKVKLRIKTGNGYEKRKMVNIFQNPKWKQEYAIEINKFEILENLDNEDSIDNNINEKWENIKTRINLLTGHDVYVQSYCAISVDMTYYVLNLAPLISLKYDKI